MQHNQFPRGRNYTGRLIRSLEEQYGIPVWELTPARRGYYGETWNVQGEGGPYFLKLDALPFHQRRMKNCSPSWSGIGENWPAAPAGWRSLRRAAGRTSAAFT